MAHAVGIPAKDLKEEGPIGCRQLASATSCLRCGGLLVAEPCTDFWDDAENLTVRRCVQCGELVDPIILQNRQRQPTGGLTPKPEEFCVSKFGGRSTRLARNGKVVVRPDAKNRRTL